MYARSRRQTCVYVLLDVCFSKWKLRPKIYDLYNPKGRYVTAGSKYFVVASLTDLFGLFHHSSCCDLVERASQSVAQGNVVHETDKQFKQYLMQVVGFGGPMHTIQVTHAEYLEFLSARKRMAAIKEEDSSIRKRRKT